MARKNVNPTRMELSNLKRNLVTASKGHRLLKDKRDEMMRQFIKTVKEARKLRENLDDETKRAGVYLESASAIMGKKELLTALLSMSEGSVVKVKERNVMSMLLPEFSWESELSDSELYSYGYANTSVDLDFCLKILSGMREDIVKLASLEKAIELMSGEIERTRRRVNALEYVIIPEYIETIKYIKMKLDESERESSIRLLKVKDLIIEERIKK